jgi:hypothetical protein
MSREPNMDFDLAKYVVQSAFRSGRELNELLPLLKAHCDAQTYRTMSMGIARALASIQMELINRVLEIHPALESEINQKITKYDIFI